MNKLFLILILGIIANGWCATITRYVNPSSSGGNGTTSALSGANAAYASLSAWEAAEQQDLTDTGGDIAVVNCAGTTADTTGVTVGGWTTGSTTYVSIVGDNATGKWDTGKYRLEVSLDGIALNVQNQYVRVERLQIYNNNSFGKGLGSYSVITGLYFSRNIIKGGSDGIGGGYGGERIFNNVIYDCTGTGIQLWYGGTIFVYNNTIYNCVTGIARNESTVTVKNNIVQSATNGFNGTFAASSDYNISNIASDAPSPSYRSGLATTVTFNDSTNKDFHLASGDTGAKDVGTDLSGDANLAFSDDIDGVARTGTWDIGADEFVAAGGTRRIIIFQ